MRYKLVLKDFYGSYHRDINSSAAATSEMACGCVSMRDRFSS